MQRLYGLRDAKRQPVSIWFEKKMDAKQVRNELQKEGRDVYVTLGPDHSLYRATLKPNAEKRVKKEKKNKRGLGV